MNQPTPSSSGLGPTSGGDANGHRAETVVVIRNRLGMHARPAMSFVDTASQFSASIQVIKNQQSVDAKSIMQLMMLAATQGTELKVIAEGTDAQEAVTAIEDLVNRGFDEE
ncbi:MAG: HPr family phosphocarrier protein [Phycisphaeraceae bacterium]